MSERFNSFGILNHFYKILYTFYQYDTYTKLFPGTFIIEFDAEEPEDRKLKPGIDEYEFLGSPASTLCLTRRLARR